MTLENLYAAEASERWPAEHAESERRLGAMSESERAWLMERGTEIERELGALCSDGKPADDPAVQQLIAQHYAWVSAFWTPDRDSYIGLGCMYVDDPRFAAHYEAVAPGLALLVRDAIEVWAPANL